MKWLTIRKLSIIFALSFGFYIAAYPQPTVKFLADSSSLQIKGTSNLHDWDENVQKFSVELALGYKDREVIGIDKVIFSCKSASVVSDNSIMTGKTHDALKADKYSDIIFTLSEVVSFQNNNGKITGTITGDLLLAGITKKVSLIYTGIQTSSALILKGSLQIVMADFKIEPPTALFGTLKTGEKVELNYLLQFKID
jgi:polyisoprenoid-binding protein YceI